MVRGAGWYTKLKFPAWGTEQHEMKADALFAPVTGEIKLS